jgi:hypothetical protein
MNDTHKWTQYLLKMNGTVPIWCMNTLQQQKKHRLTKEKLRKYQQP